MVRLSIYALLLALTFVVPTFQRQQSAGALVPCSSVVDEDEAYLIALKYRQDVLQVIEASDLCNSTLVVPTDLLPITTQFCEAKPPASPLSESCDSFVSLQL
jgi:hypothetical protein